MTCINQTILVMQFPLLPPYLALLRAIHLPEQYVLMQMYYALLKNRTPRFITV